MNRRELLDRLTGDDRLLVAQTWDKADRASRHWQAEFTSFLDPGQQALLEDYGHLFEAELFFFGGFPYAERQIGALAPPGADMPDDQYPLAAVTVSANTQFSKLTHRDYLGSLLSLGLKRELFGDIIVLEDGCQVILHDSVLAYVVANWTAVGRAGIKLQTTDLCNLLSPEREMEVRSATVASLRLDSIVAAAYGISRSKAADLIRAGKLKLNFRPELRIDRSVETGDVLSLLGHGRAELQEVGKLSKSGRTHIKVARLV